MHALEFISGPFCGLAVVDGSLQLIGDSETDDAECFLILFVPLLGLLQELILLCSHECDFSPIRVRCCLGVN